MTWSNVWNLLAFVGVMAVARLMIDGVERLLLARVNRLSGYRLAWRALRWLTRMAIVFLATVVALWVSSPLGGGPVGMTVALLAGLGMGALCWPLLRFVDEGLAPLVERAEAERRAS